jgi:hypothetical protein
VYFLDARMLPDFGRYCAGLSDCLLTIPGKRKMLSKRIGLAHANGKLCEGC